MNRFPQNYYSPAPPSQLRNPEDVKRQKLIDEEERKLIAKQQLQAARAQQQHALQAKNLAVERKLSRQSLRFTGNEVKCNIKMMDHQLALAYRLREAERFVIQSELTNQVFMTDEPGSGKTFAILYYLAESKKTQKSGQKANLIVVPPALVTQWMEAIEQFGAGLQSVCFDKFELIQDLAYSNHHLIDNDIAVTSTDMFPIIRGMLKSKELELHRVIVDEVDGVVDFQQIDCAPLNRPDIQFKAIPMNQFSSSAESDNKPQMLNKVVPPVPAHMIIRVSASMNVPEHQETQFPVTICHCDHQFVEESIKLEPPEYHVIRCPDIYIQTILKDFLEPKEIKALHALDFKSAVQKYQKRSGLWTKKSIVTPIDVLQCLEAYYHHELQLNLGNLREWTKKFPHLLKIDEGYGKDFASLTVENAEGELVLRNVTGRWASEFKKLESVPMHVCGVYDKMRDITDAFTEKNKAYRKKLNQHNFCGGHCLKRLDSADSHYKLPCCQLRICLECCDESPSSKCLSCQASIHAKNFTIITRSATSEKGEEEHLDKIDALLGVLLQIKDECTTSLRVILATEFSQVFTCLHPILEEAGLKAAFLEAGSSEKTDSVVKQFMDPKSDLNIVFCQITTVGRGLNLPIATHVINFQRLEPKIRLQTIGRAQRLGRTTKLHVYDILHKGE